jgi:hypothetical protein
MTITNSRNRTWLSLVVLAAAAAASASAAAAAACRYTNVPVPTIAEIQHVLARMRVVAANFEGSRQWIGSQEVRLWWCWR